MDGCNVSHSLLHVPTASYSLLVLDERCACGIVLRYLAVAWVPCSNLQQVAVPPAMLKRQCYHPGKGDSLYACRTFHTYISRNGFSPCLTPTPNPQLCRFMRVDFKVNSPYKTGMDLAKVEGNFTCVVCVVYQLQNVVSCKMRSVVTALRCGWL